MPLAKIKCCKTNGIMSSNHVEDYTKSREVKVARSRDYLEFVQEAFQCQHV